MISTIVSRLVILVFGTLYPAYASYKAVRTKNVKEYVKWMMYWIVFALFTCIETFTDVFFSFWFPFYYEIKIVLVVWLLSPATKGSSILYRKFVHPMLSKREQEIDEYISRAKEQGYHTVLHLGSKGVTYATNVIMQTAIKGGGGIVNHLRRSYSLSDLSSNTDLMADVNRNSKSLLDDGMDTGDSPREIRQRITRKAAGSHVDLYFPEMDVDLRSHSHNSRDLPVSLSQIRSSEDISSGYSSGDLLYSGDLAQGAVGENGAPLVRTSSVGATRARARGGRVSVRKAPTTAEEADNEDDFLNEDCRSRTTYNPYTTHPVFSLYPELFSMFSMNCSDVLSPEAVEFLLLKNINSKIVQIKEEPVHNIKPSSVLTQQESKMSDNVQGQVGVEGSIEISNVEDSTKNINSVESSDKLLPKKFTCGKELLDNKIISFTSDEVKSENNSNVLDSAEVFCSDIQHKIKNLEDNIVGISVPNGVTDNDVSSTVDTEVFIKESVFPVSDTLKNNNIEDKINNSVISKIFNKSNDLPSVKDISTENSDDEFLDVEPEPELVEVTLHANKSIFNNEESNNLSSELEQNCPESKIFVEPFEMTQILNSSIKQTSEVLNEHSITVENIKDLDIHSVESHVDDKDLKSHNLEVSDIESVGSVTDDCSQVDDLNLSTSISHRSDLKRKGRYGKMKAPLPPAETVNDGNIILATAQQSISLNFQSNDVGEVSSKIEDHAKDISGTPDIISQLGEKSKSANEKNNVEIKRKPVENINFLVSKEIKKTEDKEALSKLKSKEKSEYLGMSRFLPKNNMPSLFGIFSLKDESTNKALTITPTAGQIEKTVEENTAVGNVLELPENSVVKKLQHNKQTQQNIEKKQKLLEKDVEERMKRNKVTVKIRELSKSPSSHRKH